MLAYEKTVTRREWKDEYARRFKAGQLVDAWDKSPRTGRGKKVATIRLTRDPFKDWSDALPSEEWYREGFGYLTDHGQGELVERIVHDWRSRPRWVWVVNFEVVGLENAMKDKP